jgi:hypothetical protein
MISSATRNAKTVTSSKSGTRRPDCSGRAGLDREADVGAVLSSVISRELSD